MYMFIVCFLFRDRLVLPDHKARGVYKAILELQDSPALPVKMEIQVQTVHVV